VTRTPPGQLIADRLSLERSPSLERSVVAEVELLADLHAQRVFHEPLPTGIAEIEPHRPRAISDAVLEILLVKPLEHRLHLFEVIRLGLAGFGTATALRRQIVHGLKDLDFHDVVNIDLWVDGSLADIT
jgi:hypothetical protein